MLFEPADEKSFRRQLTYRPRTGSVVAMSQPPPTPSDIFRLDILAAMEPADRGRVHSGAPVDVPHGDGFLAYAVFSNNRHENDAGRRICVVRTGREPMAIRIYQDLSPSADQATWGPSLGTPFRTMREVAQIVVSYLHP
jgi:hypothetical protein